MTQRVHVSKADYLVAFAEEGHVLLRGADVVYEGNTIVHAGPPYQGEAHEIVDGRGYLVMPGLINTHGHATLEGMKKGFLEDAGSRRFYGSGLYEYGLRPQSKEGMLVTLQAGLAEMLRSGCTTVLEEGRHDDETVDVLARAGIRAFAVPMYNAGMWFTRNGHAVEWDLDEARGLRALEAAVSFIERHRGTHGGRIDALLGPHAPDTCPRSVLQATREAADTLGVPVHIHAAQSIVEFQEIVRREGQTPIQFLDDTGLLAPDVILGHCIYCSHHHRIRWRDHDDLARI